MFPAERRRRIERLVNEQGKVTIAKLSEMFNVSEMTILRDLKTLESMGTLRKIRGGALPMEFSVIPTDYRNRLSSHPEEKDLIGLHAKKFIKDRDTIFIGPGTTALYVARHCKGFQDLTVYTNGPTILNELASMPGVEVHCTGGMLSKNTMTLVGPETEQAIRYLRPDKSFIGAHGLTLENGITDPCSMEATFKRRLVEVTQEVYLVVTPDKFGNLAQQVVAPIEAIDVVITHKDTPEHYINELRKCDIRCVVVS
ncbi:MAG: DeoR/GlpR family DNA-binding transcription regulator [Anaerolineales bacterium]|jgi:DeoR/GlpR family transcriptional regulator of sugar metabolism